jgi:hypothetical protein
MKSETKNRRSGIRWMARGGVEVTCQQGNTGLGPNLAVSILDISETGIRMMVNRSLEKNEEIEINLLGPGNPRPMKILSNVAWSVAAAEGNHCIGARFQKRIQYSDFSRLTNPGT